MAPIRELHFRALCTLSLLIFGISSRLHVLASGDHGHGSIGTYVGGYLISNFGDPFEEILGRLNRLASAEERNVTFDEMAGMIPLLFEERLQCSNAFNATNCQQCLTGENLFSIIGVSPSHGLDEENFNRACIVLLYYVARLESACAESGLSARSYDYFELGVQTLIDGQPVLHEEEFEEMLHSVNRTYVPTDYAKCFTLVTAYDSAVKNHPQGASAQELPNLAAVLISGLVRGFCFGSAKQIDPDVFLNDICNTYATDGIISEEKFIEILEKLAIGSDVDSHSDSHDHDHAHRRRRHTDPSVLAEILGRRFRRSAGDGHDHDHDHDHDHGDGGEDINERIHSCLSVDDLLDTFGIDHSVGLTCQQFMEISPALIQQVVSDACVHADHTEATGPTPAQVWGYGILSVIIISLTAVAGIAVFPCLDTSIYQSALQIMIALAVATLTGDALIHLFPQALGLHSHSAGQSHEPHGPGSEELAYVWKSLVFVMTLYVLFLFESFMQMCGGGHSHSSKSNGRPAGMDAKEAMDNSVKKSESKAQLELAENEPQEGVANPKSGGCCGISSLAYMILIGDGLHNIGDGLAIGAAFTASIGAGLSTSIAILCHELPHELGDFAILLKTGMSFRKALGFNLLSAMSAFVGLCIGIPLASGNDEARQWMFAVAAGVFLYVATVDMFPQMIHNGLKNKGTIFLLHNIGFLVGTAIILVIALYEDSIRISV